MSEPFIAQIMMFGGTFAPRGWASCDGQLLAISQNTALFSLLGTTYGGDGRTTFGLPDLRGRVPMHPGQGPGLTLRRLGEKGGTEAETLNAAQIPSHSHGATTTVRCATTAGTADSPANKVWSGSSEGDQGYREQPDGTMASNAVEVGIGNTGGGQSHNNLQPYQCVNFIIALLGVYPSRP